MMNNRTTHPSSTSSFNHLPLEAQTLFTMLVVASLAVVGYTDIPTGRELRVLASQAYADLHITPEALRDPAALDKKLDAYFGKSRLAS